MRLKGGKVLIDCSENSLGDDTSIAIDSVTGKAILEKGISILIKELVNKNILICVDLIPVIIADGGIYYQKLTDDSGDTYSCSFIYDVSDYSGALNITMD